jgi:hypothetical protein
VGQFAETLRAHRFGRRTDRPSRLRFEKNVVGLPVTGDTA